MELRAIIENREYHLLETIPGLNGQKLFAICEDSEGRKFVCPEDFWLHHALKRKEVAPVHKGSASQEKIDFFLSLFQGRKNIYARRYYSLKTGKSGYVPTCQNEWVPGICDKKAHWCPDCPNRAFVPLTEKVIRAHLMGKDEFCRDVVGIYPMLEGDHTWLLAVDFDDEKWQEDVSAFREVCVSFGITPAVERSRSGNGAHAWFFFSEPVAAADARKFGSGLLTQAMARRHELSFKSYDRMFPSQDTVPKGGFGNLIALPFQGRAQQSGNTLFLDEQFVPYMDQWAFLSTLHRITPGELIEYLTQLCISGEMGLLLESTKQKPWPEKRKPKELMRKDFPMQARLMISNFLYVDKTGFSQSALNTIKRLAAFKNPEFYKKQAMRLPVYNTPGVLSATTAFGKTVVAAYLIGQRKVNTLILVHSSALLEQWKTSLEQFLAIREVLPEQPKRRGRKKRLEHIGQIGAGKNTRSGIIDIAIMQSLFEGDEKDVKSFVSEYGMVLCDECHHVAAFTFEKILREVRARYVYGLSATPVRQDGHQPIIFMQCGPVRYLVDAKSQAEKRAFSHYVIPRFTRTRLPAARKLQDIYAGIIGNEMRNSQIISDATRLIEEGRTPLLLTERKEHAAQLAQKLQGRAKHIFLLLGSGGQKEKREKLAALQAVPANESLVVVATGKYIGEGFDEPRLDTILLSMPVSWKGTLAQYAGRLHRNYEGKQEVRIYDYVDIHIPTLERMYHKRLKGYAELGYQVNLSEKDPDTSQIYDSQNYLTPFMTDLGDAAKEVLLVCPFLNRSRAKAVLSVLEKAIVSGIGVTVCTRSLENYPAEQRDAAENVIMLLADGGVIVETQSGLLHRYAIIDRSIVWYGNIDYLSYNMKDANALRFESPDTAGELLELWKDNTISK